MGHASFSRPASAGRALVAGLLSGSIAAFLASLASLPLHSPDDVFFNTASVTVGALLTGLMAGLVWWAVRQRGLPVAAFAGCLALTFAVVAIATLAVEVSPSAPVEGVAPFFIPLAAIALGVVALLTPVVAQSPLPVVWIAPPATLAALAFGVALAGQGDAESGTLALPESPSIGRGASSDGLLRRQDVLGVTFTVVPGESVATYTVREKLADLPLPNDAVGRTSAITGTIHLDGRPSKVTVDLRTLQSDQPRRDRFIREQGGLPFNRYPFAEFTVTDLPDLPTEYRPGETVRRDVTGLMKIREVERPLTFTVEARLDGDTLYILGTTDFTWDDFQIPPPNIRGLVQVENNIHLEVLLVAKREGSGS